MYTPGGTVNSQRTPTEINTNAAVRILVKLVTFKIISYKTPILLFRFRQMYADKLFNISFIIKFIVRTFWEVIFLRNNSSWSVKFLLKNLQVSWNSQFLYFNSKVKKSFIQLQRLCKLQNMFQRNERRFTSLYWKARQQKAIHLP